MNTHYRYEVQCFNKNTGHWYGVRLYADKTKANRRHLELMILTGEAYRVWDLEQLKVV